MQCNVIDLLDAEEHDSDETDGDGDRGEEIAWIELDGNKHDTIKEESQKERQAEGENKGH